MHRAIRRETGNLLFSGTSLRTALAMAALGAKGATFDEIVKALGLPPDARSIVEAGKAESAAWKAGARKAELAIANRLWLDRSAALEKAFAAQARDGFGAAPEAVDFVHAAEPSRARINAWVSDATKGKIQDLLPQGSIDAMTRLVLTNAIYFKGTWRDAFDKRQTKDGAFRADVGAVTVPMMRRTGDMAYASNAEVELVQLPYEDSDLVMLLALPHEDVKVQDTESEITGGKIDAWARSVATQRIDLTMPKFAFSWGRSVKAELRALGITTAFGDEADFTGVSTKPRDLYISDVFHKAFIAVDETGTEAAAATGAVMATRGMVSVKAVKLDRPFLFFLRNQKTSDVLFQGRVANPKS